MSEAGFVAVLVIDLHFPESGSLKSKRKELSSIKAQLHGRLGVAVGALVRGQAEAVRLADRLQHLVPRRPRTVEARHYSSSDVSSSLMRWLRSAVSS